MTRPTADQADMSWPPPAFPPPPPAIVTGNGTRRLRHAHRAPFLLAHGTADSVVPCTQSELLAELLCAQGVEVTLRPVQGTHHIFLGPDAKPIVAEAVTFLARHLRPRPQP